MLITLTNQLVCDELQSTDHPNSLRRGSRSSGRCLRAVCVDGEARASASRRAGRAPASSPLRPATGASASAGHAGASSAGHHVCGVRGRWRETGVCRWRETGDCRRHPSARGRARHAGAKGRRQIPIERFHPLPTLQLVLHPLFHAAAPLEDTRQGRVLLELFQEPLEPRGQGLVAHAREEPAQTRLFFPVVLARARRGVRRPRAEAVSLGGRRHTRSTFTYASIRSNIDA